MKGRNENLFLADIKECCEKIEEYIEGVSKEDYLANKMLQDALVRNIEIIGEAAKNLSDETRGESPEIPWRDVVRMRDKIVHHYFRINLEVIWQTATEDIAALKVQIEKVIEKSVEK